MYDVAIVGSGAGGYWDNSSAQYSVTLDLDDPADAWASAGSARSYLRSLGY